MSVTQLSAIARLVRETRQEVGLTQEQLAAKLGVSYQSVNRWENGRAIPSPLAIKSIDALLHQLGARAQVLLTKDFGEERE